MRELILVVDSGENGLTAADFLKRRGFSHRIITSLKQNRGLTRSGKILRTIDTVACGERIRAAITDEGSVVPNPSIVVDIAYEDEDIVVYDKPPFLPVHPSLRHYDDTLANAFAAHYEGIAFRPINRLDKNTSGLCVCAKNRLAAAKLTESIEKVYYAIVDGNIDHAGRISAPIGRTGDSIIKRCVREDGKSAVTSYTPIAHDNGRTLLRIVLETGRTHQIRVHFAHIGFPLCGDDMYGGDCGMIERQALHCGEVGFVHPITGRHITLKAELPQDMQRLMEIKRCL